MTRLRLMLKDGRNLWRESPFAFGVSLKLMASLLAIALLGRFSSHVEVVESRLFKTFAHDLTPGQQAVFRRNPSALSISLAHRATCLLWFIPMTRYQMVYNLAERMQRFWAWSEGLATSPESSP